MITKTGFTIVELLLVLVIITILSVIIISVVTNRSTDARYTQAIADLDALRSAITMYQIDLDNLPPSTDPSTSPVTFGNAVLLKALTVSMSGGVSTAPVNWHGPYIDVKGMRLSQNSTSFSSATVSFILDPWDNPYSYIVYTDYTAQQDWASSTSATDIYFGTPGTNGTDIYINPKTYQIFSKGKNGFSNETTFGSSSTSLGGTDIDDVNNWFGDERSRDTT